MAWLKKSRAALLSCFTSATRARSRLSAIVITLLVGFNEDIESAGIDLAVSRNAFSSDSALPESPRETKAIARAQCQKDNVAGIEASGCGAFMISSHFEKRSHIKRFLAAIGSIIGIILIIGAPNSTNFFVVAIACA